MKWTICMGVALASFVLTYTSGCGGGGDEEPPPPEPVVVLAGSDCWSTSCGRTQASFCRLPIPPDFFIPGSFPFQGVVRLQGRVGGADTQVERKQDMTLTNVNDMATVPIELIALDLVSCEPIIVDTIQGPTIWDVEVTLSDVTPTQLGQMTVTKTHENGGTFVSELVVQPKFTFTSNQEVRVLDTGQLPLQPDVLQILGEAPWVHELKPPLAGAFDPCGTNFVPGVRENPTNGEQCCGETCHADPSGKSTHCTTPPNCLGCPDGACCMSDGSCTVVSATQNQTAAAVCAAAGGEYKGNGTDCTTDTDADSLPDIKENNHCCGSQDACNLGSSPVNPDSDGDGVTDGDEVTNGTDPCDPNDF